MKHVFTTDYHIGKSTRTNTTLSSRERLKRTNIEVLNAILDRHPADFRIMLGDLFDSARVSPEDEIHGAKLAAKNRIVLSGNHDMVPQKDKASSFEAVGILSSEESFLANDFGEAKVYTRSCARVTYTAVPHCANQELFNRILKEVAPDTSSRKQILLLHCNYNNGFAQDIDAALNLEKVQAEEILDRGFDYILIGHEHQAATHLGGRVKIVGNQQPLSFSDINGKNKTYLVYDDKTDEWIERLSWDAQKAFELKVENTPNLFNEQDIPQGVEFLTITGELPREKAAKLQRKIGSLWSNGELFAIRSLVNYTQGEKALNATTTLDNLEEEIAKTLTGPTLELYKRLRGEVE